MNAWSKLLDGESPEDLDALRKLYPSYEDMGGLIVKVVEPLTETLNAYILLEHPLGYRFFWGKKRIEPLSPLEELALAV